MPFGCVTAWASHCPAHPTITRPPFARGDGNLPLSKPVRSAMLVAKLRVSGECRMIALRLSRMLSEDNMRKLLVVGVTMWLSSPVFAFTGQCILQVDGTTYINRPCNIKIYNGGSFSIGQSDDGRRRDRYFAMVEIDPSAGTAVGYWNGVDGESHAGDNLGNLIRQGACWVNNRARVCAMRSTIGRTENQRPHPESNQSATIHEDYDCKQIITLYAFTSKAQLECGFSGYSGTWRQRAQECNADLDDENLLQSYLRNGLSMYHQAIREKGKRGACEEIYSAFPDAIRR